MKKYIVVWRPKRGGKVVFRSEVSAPDTLIAQAMVGVPAQGEVVSVSEYPQASTAPLLDDLLLNPPSMPAWGTYGT